MKRMRIWGTVFMFGLGILWLSPAEAAIDQTLVSFDLQSKVLTPFSLQSRTVAPDSINPSGGDYLFLAQGGGNGGNGGDNGGNGGDNGGNGGDNGGNGGDNGGNGDCDGSQDQTQTRDGSLSGNTYQHSYGQTDR